MNVTWMRGILDDYVRLAELVSLAEEQQVPEEAHKQHDEMQRLLYPINAIFLKLNEAPVSAGLGHHDRSDPAWFWVRNGQHAQGVLKHLDAVAEMNRTESPTLNAAALHPWVWEAAAPFWTAGHYAVGVETGAKSLTAFLQNKSGSKYADRELAADLFSQRPRACATRLWLPGDRDTDTWKSRQDGLHNLAMGAYAGIRNVAAHSVETGWSEQEALEYLAVLSTVARWAEETEVVVCE